MVHSLGLVSRAGSGTLAANTAMNKFPWILLLGSVACTWSPGAAAPAGTNHPDGDGPFATPTHLLAAASPVDATAARQPEGRRFLQGKTAPDVPKTVLVANGQQCEAWFYCGVRRLLAGDKAGAAENFRRCLATKQITIAEY